MHPSDERLQEGIAAYKRGQNEQAGRLINQAIRLNPKNERAWLWYSGFVETDEQRRDCLKRVLTINPNNQVARRGLAKLTAETSHPPQEPAPPPPSKPEQLPQPPRLEPTPAPTPKEILESQPILEEEEKGSNRLLKFVILMMILIAVIFLVLTLTSPNSALSIIHFTNPQPLPENLSQEEETAVINTIYDNIAATNSENIDRYMVSIHTQSPGYEETRELLENQFIEYDLTAVISRLELISYSPEEAQVQFSLETRKRAGPEFRDNLMHGIFILRPEDGQWKLYDQVVNDIKYLE